MVQNISSKARLSKGINFPENPSLTLIVIYDITKLSVTLHLNKNLVSLLQQKISNHSAKRNPNCHTEGQRENMMQKMN